MSLPGASGGAKTGEKRFWGGSKSPRVAYMAT